MTSGNSIIYADHILIQVVYQCQVWAECYRNNRNNEEAQAQTGEPGYMYAVSTGEVNMAYKVDDQSPSPWTICMLNLMIWILDRMVGMFAWSVQLTLLYNIVYNQCMPKILSHYTWCTLQVNKKTLSHEQMGNNES